MFLGPRQSSTSAASRVTECPVWLSSGLTMTEKHMAAYTFLCAKSAYGIDTISAGMGCVQTPKANTTVCKRSSFEVSLNTCQDTSLLFLLAILTKAATQEIQWKRIQPSKSPLPYSRQAHQLVIWCIFFMKEQQFPSHKHPSDHAPLE